MKWASVVGATVASASFVASDAVAEEAAPKGEWKTAPCAFNCCCGASRCLTRVYMEDGVPLKIITDEGEESIENPQRRACCRGRAQISNILSPARIKYPMKRKSWSPEAPNGELRGLDEWERISWEEALDIVAAQVKKTVDEYTTRGILCCAYGGTNAIDSILNIMGGALHHEMATVSFGSWPIPEQLMTGGLYSSPDALSFMKSKMHVMFGNNWMANKGGNTAYHCHNARANGAKMIFIDPWKNQTAEAVADEWIPVLPGTDTALVLAICHEWIVNGTYDQAYLDKYTIGFDADHMPEGANPDDNFKDYVLGTFDGEPKTPEWATAICGTPAQMIRDLAAEIAACDKVNFFAGQSTTKTPAGEMFAQAFYTMALMHGGIGTEGNYMSWAGLKESSGGWVSAGAVKDASKTPVNPLNPAGLAFMFYPIPTWAYIPDDSAWDNLEYSELWVNVLKGEYGNDTWPNGPHKIDVHQIYNGGLENSLNSIPNLNKGIEVFRKMDFVWGARPYFDMTAQYSDILLPVAMQWERHDLASASNAETLFFYEHITDPLFESKPEDEIAAELAKRLGIDVELLNIVEPKVETYNSLAGSTYTAPDGSRKPVLTITQEDIDAMGVEGVPQEGAIDLATFKEEGLFRIHREHGDVFEQTPYEAFYNDPVANPLPTASGKFEIYCAALAYAINSVAFSTISPIAKWQVGDPEQGPAALTDEWPLLLWTPHSLRRAHTVNDNVYSLREAFPQELFINTVDAEARGIKTGDIVLVSSPHGKMLRPAKVLPTVVPGAVAAEDGAWTRIDPETGIDMAGNPNTVQAPKASGEGSQSWSGTICQVEKYTGHLTVLPDKNVPIVMPEGIEE